MSNIEGPGAFIVERASYRKSGASSWRELASAARAVNTEGRGIGAAAPSTVQSGAPFMDRPVAAMQGHVTWPGEPPRNRIITRLLRPAEAQVWGSAAASPTT